MTNPVRIALLLAWDSLATVAALYAAVLLRFVGELPPTYAHAAKLAAPLLVASRVSTIVAVGAHRWSFRLSGAQEAARLALAMIAASVVFVLGFGMVSPVSLPRAVVALEFFVSTSLIAGLRFFPRVVDGWYADRQRRSSADAARTIIVGAGVTGDVLARDLLRPGGARYFVVGFVDDDPSKRGMSLHGKPVLGPLRCLPALIERHRVATVLLAIPSMPAAQVREILLTCARSKTSFKKIGASYEHLDSRITAAMLHDLCADDLLPRDPVAFDGEEIRARVAGRRALVTGAAGSIGSETCRQLAASGVAELVMVDMNENELYLLRRMLEQVHPSVRLHSEIADIRELPRLSRLAAQYAPQLVVHAAAHKHVPLMEDAPEEAVRNNVFGTLNVAIMAHESHVEQLVVISTDKAVNPSSVMGATKRIAEMVVRDLAARSETRMTAVRFGNVLGSAGSVVPVFKQQLARGGPVTVTHPECTRYFMTISEAVGLVLIAGLGGYGPLCVLDMGEPIRIADLALNLITLAGRVPGLDVPVVYTGLRPGEKLHEELLTEEEEQTVQVRNRISAAHSPPPPADFARQLHELQESALAGDRQRLIATLSALVPTFRRADAGRATPWPRPVPGPGRAEANLDGMALDGVA